MRTGKKLEAAILRARRTACGRLFCKAFGEKTGAVMMEYVILGLLVAAAVVVAVMFFGKNIKLGFNSMGQAVSGESQDAAKTVKESKRTADQGERASERHRQQIADK